jgi:hypothetical protein
MEKKKRLMPYSMVLPGFEAVYTGEKVTRSNEISEKKKIESCHYADESGNVNEKWSVWTWTRPSEEKDWGEEIKYINKMQEKLGSLDDKTRQIRAHIGSLVPCDSGFPVTVDELLNAIGRGELNAPSFHNGCWQCGMWWDTRGTQPFQTESMRTIDAVLRGYLAGTSKEELIARFPYAKGFINRTYEWLGPVSKLSRMQKLIMKWILLLFEFWTNYSMTSPSTHARQLCDSLVKDIFGIEFDPDKGSWITCEGGRGPKLNDEISKERNNRDLKEIWDRIKDAKKHFSRLPSQHVSLH